MTDVLFWRALKPFFAYKRGHAHDFRWPNLVLDVAYFVIKQNRYLSLTLSAKSHVTACQMTEHVTFDTQLGCLFS